MSGRTTVARVIGDFRGWHRVIDRPGEVMAWHWPAPLDLRAAPAIGLFPAVAIGIFADGELAIRTPAGVPASIVTPLRKLVAEEIDAGRPVAISMEDDDVAEQPGVYRLFLHAPDADVLDRFGERLDELLADEDEA